jgi:hypothetical protein
MEYIRTAWYWLVFSANDPQKVSLSVKAFLITLLTYGTVLAGFAHITLPSELLTQLIDGIVMLVQAGFMLVSVVTTIVGLVRKIGMTFAGTNKVLNSQ